MNTENLIRNAITHPGPAREGMRLNRDDPVEPADLILALVPAHGSTLRGPGGLGSAFAAGAGLPPFPSRQ